jgi:hypothetical protein
MMRIPAVCGLRRLGTFTVMAVVAAACWPLTALADAASPWSPGAAIGEPTGAVAHVAITHEDLTFDLRPLADAQPVQVHATYLLRNDAAATTALLVFLADRALTDASTFMVTFDDTPVAAMSTTLTQLPDAWKAPISTPSLIDGTSIPYNPTPGTAFQFTVVIPPGPHRLSVTYAVLPGRYVRQHATTIWQVAYVLAPARQWASFGDLSVQAQLPAGWRARTIPALARNKDALEGHFVGLPADSMVISTSFPVDPYVQGTLEWMATQWPLYLGLLLITAAGAATLSWLTRRRWLLAPLGSLWAFPAAWQWIHTAYVTPPATQYSTGKCGCLILLPGAVTIAVIAAGFGVLAVVATLFIAAAVWGRLRRTRVTKP